MLIAALMVCVAAPAGGEPAAAPTPEPWGPLATGSVLRADGQPAADATVYFFLRLAGGYMSNGGAKAQTDGTFALRHPYPNDRRVEMEPTQFIVWAKRPNEASAPVINRSGAMTLALRAYDPKQLAQVEIVALDGASGERWGGDLRVLLAPGRAGMMGLMPLSAGRVLERADVIPGPHAFMLLDELGFHVGDELANLEGGKRTVIEMPFVVGIPEGRVGASLQTEGGRVTVALVVPGSPAQRAGLKLGDELLAIDGQPATDVERSKALLVGKAGEGVRVTVVRDQARHELELRRSGPPTPVRAALRAHSIVPPDPELGAAAASIEVRAGERVVTVVPLHRPARGGDARFTVRIPDGVGVKEQLRVIVDFGKELFYRSDGEAGLPIVITTTGPGDFTSRKEYNYYNMVRDPLGRGHDASTSEPGMGFDYGELDTEGVYHITVKASGYGEVQRTFRVTGPLSDPVYQRHQHRRIGDYELRTRAVLELQPDPAGSDKAWIYRAVFARGKETLEVDMVERQNGRAVMDWFFAAAPWPAARDVTLELRHRTLKLHRTGAGFLAAWPSGSLVVRVRGRRYGKQEQQLVDHYMMLYESKWRPPGW